MTPSKRSLRSAAATAGASLRVGMDRTHVTRGVALSAVEQREVDAASGEQLRDRARDGAGAADRENAHVQEVIGVG